MSRGNILVPVIVAGFLIAIGFGAFFLFGSTKDKKLVGDVIQSIGFKNGNIGGSKVFWEFNQESGTWMASGTVPECPDPLVFPAPVEVNLASGILYPGQVRGGDYKAHGGFRFDNLESNRVEVKAPIDGGLVRAARHLESGEVQYSLYFVNECGIMYKLDHLRELTGKLEKIVEKIRMGGEGDSRTTEVNPAVLVSKGELIATKVGFEQDRNIFVDFGVYDLRRKNGVVYDADFRAKYFNIDEFGTYAICWLDNLEEPAGSVVKNLPGADGVSGKKSDYCK